MRTTAKQRKCARCGKTYTEYGKGWYCLKCWHIKLGAPKKKSCCP